MPRSTNVEPAITSPYNTRDSSARTSTATLQENGILGSEFSTPVSPDDRGDDTATVHEGGDGDPTDLVKQRQTEEEQQTRNDARKLNEPSNEKGLQKAWRWTKLVLSFLLDQWFVLGVGFVIVSSRFFTLETVSLSCW